MPVTSTDSPAPSRYRIVSLGCPKNTVDSERYAGVLSAAGLLEASDTESADLILLNTCAFIAPAVEESLEHLYELMDWKRRLSGRKLVLAGCLPGRFPDDGTGGLEDIDLIIGPEGWPDLARWLSLRVLHPPMPLGTGHNRFLKIGEGCSNRCAYCTIPQIRGPWKPVPADTILREADALVAQGAREIGLVAQDSGSWNMNGSSLEQLVSSLAERHSDVWWRVYYLHPLHFPHGLPDIMARHGNVVPYIDLPVQHASGQILRRMGRGHDEALLNSIMAGLDDLPFETSVRYTVITGYPGETSDDFRTLLDFLGSYRSGRHIAAFSWYPEEGTAECSRALEKGDHIDQQTASMRLAAVSSVADALYDSWGARLLGRTITVLADSESTGHTAYDAPDVDGEVSLTSAVTPGEFVKARVVSVSGADTVAEPIHE
jgi:ribosomal protein S12 methylthiotransferase